MVRKFTYRFDLEETGVTGGRLVVVTDELWIVGTIHKRKANYGQNQASYRILQNEPKSLKENEFCYGLHIPIDLEKWKNRIVGLSLPEIQPTGLPSEKMSVPEISTKVGKSQAEQILENMKGEETDG